MQYYSVIAIFLNFLVNVLLLIGTSRVCGITPRYKMAFLASALNCMCFFVGMRAGVVNNGFFRITSILLSGFVAFGFHITSARPCVVVLLQHFAISGVAVVSHDNLINILVAAFCICVVSYIGLFAKPCPDLYIPVEITYHGMRMKVCALRDTGNLLTDPLTGNSVIILCFDCAQKLTGLTRQQLENPIETLRERRIPGLRILPYSTLGNPNGMLLAIYIQDVRLGNRKVSRLIALAPDNFCGNMRYQAIAGGNVC